MSDNSTVITLRLTAEEKNLITALAQERGLSAPADVLRALLHDDTEIYDTLWDKTFEASQDVLDKLADEAHAEYLAGLTKQMRNPSRHRENSSKMD